MTYILTTRVHCCNLDHLLLLLICYQPPWLYTNSPLKTFERNWCHFQSAVLCSTNVRGYMNLLRKLTLTCSFIFLFFPDDSFNVFINLFPFTKALEHSAHQYVNTIISKETISAHCSSHAVPTKYSVFCRIFLCITL